MDPDLLFWLLTSAMIGALGIATGYNTNLSAGGVTIQDGQVFNTDGVIAREPTVPSAKALSSWVKTDANTAAGNLAGGHGWSNGTYDVYWTGGARFDVAVTISTNACALDGGTGDDFPASADTTVVLALQTQVNVDIDGDNLSIIGLHLVFADTSLRTAGRILFEDAAGDDIADLEMVGNIAQIYNVAAGGSNPFTGDPITVARVSHANTSATATLKIAGAVDSTP